MADATATRTLVERIMPHPLDKIWRALAQGPLIEEWLMKNDFEPVVGCKFNFRSMPGSHWNGVVDCEVLVVESNHRLSYSWNASGGKAATGLKTIVTWILTPTDGARMCAWSSRVSGPKTYAITRAQTMAGRNTSPGWKAWRRGCNE